MSLIIKLPGKLLNLNSVKYQTDTNHPSSFNHQAIILHPDRAGAGSIAEAGVGLELMLGPILGLGQGWRWGWAKVGAGSGAGAGPGLGLKLGLGLELGWG